MIPLLSLALALQSPQAPVWPTAKGAVSILGSAKRYGGTQPGAGSIRLDGGSLVFPNALAKTPSTTEILMVPDREGNVVDFNRGFLFLFAREGQLLLGGTYIPQKLMPYTVGEPLLLSIVVEAKQTAVYANGQLLKFGPFRGRFEPKLQVGNRWSSSDVLNVVHFDRALSSKEIKEESDRALAHAKSVFADTATVTFEGQLGAFTPVPDPARIKPYRNALLAYEYTILSLKEGHMKGLKPGAKVRVFRYGVWDGKRTALENLKTGDKTRLTVKPLASDPALEREYQLDSLDVDVSATYYVEVPAAKNP